MRLHLTVQRQGLPPVQVLWTTTGLRPTPAAGGASTTISQLLEQVNEVIPLEAEEWGLEDYSVEVGGFECLHFAELCQILKEEDHVNIRPLQTTDLRYRKVSGRHQISSDGKHLFDGVAFGRPFLRRADRPAIRIPPRKRIRFSYDDGEESDGIASQHGGLQVALTTRSNNANEEGIDDSEEDEDFVPSEEEIGALDEEIVDLTTDVHVLADKDTPISLTDPERTVNLNGAHERPGRRTRSTNRRQGLGIQDVGVLALVDENGRQYPGAYHNPLLDYYDQEQTTQSAGKDEKKQSGRKPRQKGINPTTRPPANPERSSRRSSSVSMKGVRFEDDEAKTPATIREIEDTDESDDEDFQPNQEMDADSPGSNKENVKPELDPAHLRNSSLDTDESSSITSSDSELESESDSSETSSSLSSSAVTSPESEVEQMAKSPSHRVAANVTPAKEIRAITKGLPSKSQQGSQAPTNTAPGKGRRQTKKRNERRRQQKRIINLKNIGVLPPGATILDYKIWSENRQEAKESGISEVADDQVDKVDLSAAFESKRQELLESIASGGVNVEQIGDAEQVASTPHTTVDHIVVPGLNEESATTADDPQKPVEVASEPPRRRAKLDLASSRRLLFGSLGHRTPKTKGEENKLREKLMEDVRPMKVPQEQSTDRVAEDEAANNLGNDDRWRDKIILKAVECCYDGVVLSTPPFPFVQRWDPQQQGRSQGSGEQGTTRSKKRKRNKPHVYEEDQMVDQNFDTSIEKPQQEIVRNGPKLDSASQQEQTDAQRDETVEYQNAVDDQLMRDTHGQSTFQLERSPDVPDLPRLPEDMSTCVVLVKEIATPGSIIAFKQLDMSQETNWQPRVSDYRTAVIDKIVEEGRFQMTLSQRDRPRKEKYYDQETGERLYSKFEMPDYDEDEPEGSAGFIEVTFAELIEPKLIRAGQSRASEQLPMTDQVHASALDISTVEDGKEMVPQPDDAAREQIEEVLDEVMAEVAESPQNKRLQATENQSNMVAEEEESFEVNEESRKEISLLIKDAGFRSSIPSDLGRGHQGTMPGATTGGDGEVINDGPTDAFYPRFNGFSSSPPAEESSKLKLDVVDAALDVTHADIQKSTPLQSNGFLNSVSPPAEVDQTHQEAENPVHNIRDAKDATSGAGESVSQESITTLGNMGIERTQARKALEKHGGDISKALNWVLDHQDENGNIHDGGVSSGPEETVDNVEDLSDESWLHSPDVYAEDHEHTSPKRSISSSQPRTASQVVRSKGHGFRDVKSTKYTLALNGADSDDDFPTIENVFSTARTTFERRSSDEEDRQHTRASQRSNPRSAFSQRQQERSLATTQPPRSTEAQRLVAYTAKIERDEAERAAAEVSPSSDDDDDEDEIPPRSSAAPMQSQIVDLTISSSQDDPPPESEHEDVSSGLPRGPGWVQKKRSARRSMAATKGAEKTAAAKGRKTRSM